MKFKTSKVFVVFIHLIAGLLAQNENETEFTLIVKSTNRDMIEFIEEGKRNMSTAIGLSTIQKKAIMVLGVSGTGKSTLVNYLSNVPLIWKTAKGKSFIELDPQASSLPGGFKIGGGSTSETLIPAAYTPPGKDFSFVDTPGFSDTRGMALDIANGYFRAEVANYVTEFKFLLLITQKDLDDRGLDFRRSIKLFSNFLGIFDTDDMKNLNKSVAIIVTKVEYDDETDEEMKEYFQLKMLGIIAEEKEAKKITTNEEKVFREIVSNNRIELTPKRPRSKQGRVSTIQASRILSMADKLEYIKTFELRFRVGIASDYIAALFNYINNRYEKFQEVVETTIKQRIFKYYINAKAKISNARKDAKIYSDIINFAQNGVKTQEFKSFIENVNIEIVNNETKQHLLTKKSVLDFCRDLLPTENKELFKTEKQWVSIDFITELNNLTTDLIEDLKRHSKHFEEAFESRLNDSISKYWKKNEVKTLQVARTMYEMFIELLSRCDQTENFETFMNFLSIIDASLKQDLILQLKDLNAFINLLPENRKNEFIMNKKWCSRNIHNKVNQLMANLRKYLKEQYTLFERSFERILLDSVIERYINVTKNAIYIEDVKMFKVHVEDLRSKGRENLDFEKFSKHLNSSALGQIDKKKLLDRYRNLVGFINLLTDGEKLSTKKQWIGETLNLKLEELLQEIEKYDNDQFNYDASFEVTYTGHFAKMSNILSKINSQTVKTDVKIVKIYATHSLIFDVDYKIPETRYSKNAPDLVIITKTVIVKQKITVDLSCYKVPGYPDNKMKADNGRSAGASGYDGKPGLPGGNGGNMLIIAETIVNQDYISLFASGGKGGPGQYGNLFYFLTSIAIFNFAFGLI